jgi:tetratricopeptide (TPR) repeat protein
VVPGFTQSSRRFKSSEQADKVENRFAGKMLFGLFNYLQYFDCHSLTIDRGNSCGLKGHEIETLIDRYIKFAAISFEYPAAITWFTETQFLWNYQDFIELCPPLLGLENFPRYSEVITLDFEPVYSKQTDYGPDFKSWAHKPELSLKAHIFDDLSKYVFYTNVAVLANEKVSVNDLNSALSLVDTFLDESGFDSTVLESMASCREEFHMTGYPTLSLFRAYLLNLLGEEDQARIATKEIEISDVPMLKYFLTKSLSASDGTGREILEQLWAFFQANYEVDSSGSEQNEEYVANHEERSLTVTEQLYFLADRFNEAGDTETALDLWARSARGGLLSGLASYTWTTLKNGAFDAGVALYEECGEIPCNPPNLSEKLNCKGNYLLNLLARDDDYESAIRSFNSLVLEEGDDTTYVNHMSLAILEHQYGDRVRAIQMFKTIPSEALIQLRQAYEEEAKNAKGWLLGWCLQVSKVLSEIGKG